MGVRKDQFRNQVWSFEELLWQPSELANESMGISNESGRNSYFITKELSQEYAKVVEGFVNWISISSKSICCFSLFQFFFGFVLSLICCMGWDYLLQSIWIICSVLTHGSFGFRSSMCRTFLTSSLRLWWQYLIMMEMKIIYLCDSQHKCYFLQKLTGSA